MHRLLALETGERPNAWYDVKESVVQTAGYLDDIACAIMMSVLVSRLVPLGHQDRALENARFPWDEACRAWALYSP